MIADVREAVPPPGPTPGGPLQIACDESGYEGEKLIGTTTDVFAHGSVRLDIASASDCMQELRDRIRSPATEYKANHVLREKHRSVLRWLLGPSGPLQRGAHVFLIDKAYFVVGKVIDVLLAEVGAVGSVGPAQDAHVEGMAVALYRQGRDAFPGDHWEAFLASSNDLLRAKDRPDGRAPVDSFFQTLEVMRRAGTPGQANEILDLLWRARPRAEWFRARLLEDPTKVLHLDPLVPAIVGAVVHWGAGRQPIAIVHDRQNTLTAERIAQIKDAIADRSTAPDNAGGAGLTSLTLVDSMVDPRVQVADVLAGTVRKLASNELNGRADANLTELLRPYVDPCSIWGDERSWRRFGGTPTMASPNATAANAHDE